MPFKFPCKHCGQTLKVSTKKVGRRETCPACKGPIVVPSVEEAETALAAANKSRRDSGEYVDPLSEFVVYDDDTEPFHEEDEAPLLEGPIAATVDVNKIAVSRQVIYLQGALLGIVALLAFGLGIVVGSGATSTPVTVQDRPFTLTGKLTHNAARGEQPDDGAVVIVLPVDGRPDRETKIPVEPLLPTAPLPPASEPAIAMIQQLGGVYARTDAQGSYRVQLPRQGNYHVLFLSRTAPGVSPSRTDDLERARQREDLAKMLAYFDDAPLFVNRHAYHWRTAKFTGDGELSHQFE